MQRNLIANSSRKFNAKSKTQFASYQSFVYITSDSQLRRYLFLHIMSFCPPDILVALYTSETASFKIATLVRLRTDKHSRKLIDQNVRIQLIIN